MPNLLIPLINSINQCKPLLPELHNCELHLPQIQQAHRAHHQESTTSQGRGLAPCTVGETRQVRASTSSLSLKKAPRASSTPA